MAVGRILTKDLDTRLANVEERIEELIGRIGLLDEQARQLGHAQSAAEQAHATNGNGGGLRHEGDVPADKIAELEAGLSRLDERVEKIASTVVASRWS